MANTNEYNVKLNVTLLYNPNNEQHVDRQRQSFASFETVKTLPFPPTKEYGYLFELKNKKKDSATQLSVDYNLFPATDVDPGYGNIYWVEKTSSFEWSTKHSYDQAFMMIADLEEYRDEKWKLTRCFINGKKATINELIAVLKTIDDASDE